MLGMFTLNIQWIYMSIFLNIAQDQPTLGEREHGDVASSTMSFDAGKIYQVSYVAW
jgi:hypothetical protein